MIVASVGPSSIDWYEETPQGRRKIAESDRHGESSEEMSARATGAVWLRLPKSSCFERSLLLPAAARADFAHIIKLDMESSTPFSENDIFHDIVFDNASTRADGNLDVRHVVVKRGVLEAARQDLERHGFVVEGTDCWEEDGVNPVAINFLSPAFAERPKTSLLPVWGTVAVAALLIASAVFVDQSRNEQALQTLDAQLATAKSMLQELRAKSAAAEAAFARGLALTEFVNASVQPSTILAELTRRTSDDTYLTELRLERTVITIAGYAAQAAPLVPTLEASPILSDVAMMAPVTFDSATNKEQFRIKAELSSQHSGGER